MVALIHPEYLTEESEQQLRRAFLADKEFPSVACKDFLDAAPYRELQKHMQRLRFQREEQPGGHCFGKAALPAALREILESKEVLGFLESLLNKKIKKIAWNAYCFQWKDYWLLPEQSEPAAHEVLFDLSGEWREDASGLIVLRDAHGNFLKLPAGGNIVAVVERKKGLRRYVQYVNHYAGKQKRYLILGKIDCSRFIKKADELRSTLEHPPCKQRLKFHSSYPSMNPISQSSAPSLSRRSSLPVSL